MTNVIPTFDGQKIVENKSVLIHDGKIKNSDFHGQTTDAHFQACERY